MKNLNYKIGRKGEDIAVKYLIRNGAEIIARNFRYDRGEIDIVAKCKNSLVFVEVKTRTNVEFGTPVEAVNYKKAAQVKKTAEGFLIERGEEIDYDEIRFDIIGILLHNENEEINHIPNAF